MTSCAARFPTFPARLALALSLAAAGAASLPATAAQVPPAAPTATVSNLPDFTGLVATVGPAVVNIRTNLKPPKPEEVDQLSLQRPRSIAGASLRRVALEGRADSDPFHRL